MAQPLSDSQVPTCTRKKGTHAEPQICFVVAETLARLPCMDACTCDPLFSCDDLETLGALGANNSNVSVLRPD